MRSTFQFCGNPLSLSVYFTVMILALSVTLPGAIHSGLTSNGIPEAAAAQVANLPPTGALFAVFLGYNPMQTLLPPAILGQLSPAAQANLLGTAFFPGIISSSFIDALHSVFLFSAGLTLLAAIFSATRGPRFVYENSQDVRRQEIDRALGVASGAD